ncbi:hypothetical protein [Bradyrhizobium sp. McL0616]|uniref:hypothetical protein n=1 Tax=Bradyrhizobium sp. McL0616 TaxID=3415674 RepID=UPI003CE86B1F
MHPGLPRQQRKGEVEAGRKPLAGRDTDRPRDAAAVDAGERACGGVARRVLDFCRIVDDRLAQRLRNGDGQRKNRRPLIGVGNEVDDDIGLARKQADIGLAAGQQRQDAGLVGAVLEEKTRPACCRRRARTVPMPGTPAAI